MGVMAMGTWVAEGLRVFTDWCFGTALARKRVAGGTCWCYDWLSGFSRLTGVGLQTGDESVDRRCFAGLRAEAAGLENALKGVRHGYVSGLFCYPPGGFIDWHTNIGNTRGYRMYFTHLYRGTRRAPPGTNDTAGSFFQWLSFRDGTFRKIRTRHGSLSVFAVEREQELWHAVHSAGDVRFSFGLQLPAEEVRQLFAAGALREAQGEVVQGP